MNSMNQLYAGNQSSVAFTGTPPRSAQRPIYLALDFDGVLHHAFSAPPNEQLEATETGTLSPAAFIGLMHQNNPADDCDCSSLFEYSAFVAEALRRHAQLQIVIATAWRRHMSLDTLKAVMPVTLARRVIGVLDWADERTPEHHVVAGIRGRLMVQWLQAHGDPHAPWLAIDDMEELWRDHGDRLVQTPMSGMRWPEGQDLLDRLGVLAQTSPANLAALGVTDSILRKASIMQVMIR